MTDRSTRKDNIEQIRLATKDLQEILHASVRSQDKVHVLQFVAATRVSLGDLKVRNDKSSYSPAPIQSEIRKIRQEIRKRKSSVSKISRRPDNQYKLFQLPKSKVDQETLVHIARKQEILQTLDCKVQVLEEALDQSEQKRREVQRRRREAEDMSDQLRKKLGKLESAVDYQGKISVTNQKKLMQIQAKLREQEKMRDQLQTKFNLLLKEKLDLQARNSELLSAQTRLAAILDSADHKSLELESLRSKQVSMQKESEVLKKQNSQLRNQVQKLRGENRNLLLSKESLTKLNFQSQNIQLETLKRRQQQLAKLHKQLSLAKAENELVLKDKNQKEALRKQAALLVQHNSQLQRNYAFLVQKLHNKEAELANSLRQLHEYAQQKQEFVIYSQHNEELMGRINEMQKKLNEQQDQNMKIRFQLQQTDKYSKLVQSNYYQTKRENVSLLEQMQISKEFISSINDEKQRLSAEDSLLRQRLFQSEKAREKYKIKYLNSKEGLQRLMQEKSKLQSIFREEFMAEREESLRLRSRQQQRLLSINSSFSQF